MRQTLTLTFKKWSWYQFEIKTGYENYSTAYLEVIVWRFGWFYAWILDFFWGAFHCIHFSLCVHGLHESVVKAFLCFCTFQQGGSMLTEV